MKRSRFLQRLRLMMLVDPRDELGRQRRRNEVWRLVDSWLLQLSEEALAILHLRPFVRDGETSLIFGGVLLNLEPPFAKLVLFLLDLQLPGAFA